MPHICLFCLSAPNLSVLSVSLFFQFISVHLFYLSRIATSVHPCLYTCTSFIFVYSVSRFSISMSFLSLLAFNLHLYIYFTRPSVYICPFCSWLHLYLSYICLYCLSPLNFPVLSVSLSPLIILHLLCFICLLSLSSHLSFLSFLCLSLRL